MIVCEWFSYNSLSIFSPYQQLFFKFVKFLRSMSNVIRLVVVSTYYTVCFEKKQRLETKLTGWSRSDSSWYLSRPKAWHSVVKSWRQSLDLSNSSFLLLRIKFNLSISVRFVLTTFWICDTKFFTRSEPDCAWSFDIDGIPPVVWGRSLPCIAWYVMKAALQLNVLFLI